MAAVLAGALLAFFAFNAKPAEAQAEDVSIKVEPINVDLGDIAAGSTEETTIKITNNGDVQATIGAIDLDILEGNLDPDDIQLVGENGVLAGFLDLLTGVLDLTDPLVIEPGETVELVIEVLPDGEGIINLTINLLEETSNTVLETVTVTGEGRQCTIVGTEGDDQGVTAVRDTAAGTEDQPEVVCGLGGNDEILATAGGNDIIVGGPGNDTINMKDGVRKEYASGGSGKDLCKPKDKKDKVKSCGTKKKRR
jgi:Ca2+-binding RTX toxin-like protein